MTIKKYKWPTSNVDGSNYKSDLPRNTVLYVYEDCEKGLVFITDATIDDDRYLLVAVKATDDNGKPHDKQESAELGKEVDDD